ncbi:MAG: hypothetical protein FJ286_07150 [Planctomycetes bacterium]|nr:hypothetical protein [Planctomycetota bacterium]
MIVLQERAFLNAQARLEKIRRYVEEAADSGERIDRVERELLAQFLGLQQNLWVESLCFCAGLCPGPRGL